MTWEADDNSYCKCDINKQFYSKKALLLLSNFYEIRFSGNLKQMRNIFLILIILFPNSNQLLCFLKCMSITLNSSEPFREPSDAYQCLNDTQVTNCYGQIMTYYQGSGYLKYISYSLGPRKHVIEKEIEELALKNNFKFIIYFFFLIESFDTDEVIISTFIICQTDDNCALNYVRDLINSHKKKLNPTSLLSPLLYNSNGLAELFCYNSETKQAEKCPSYQSLTCIINNTDKVEQECYSDSNTKLEYAFMITSAEKNSIKKST